MNVAKRSRLRYCGTALAALLACAAPATAKTFTVNTTADEFAPGGACSLYEAVLSAAQDESVDWGCGLRDANPSVVRLSAAVYDMTVEGRSLESNRSVEIVGAGMDKTIIRTWSPWAMVFSNEFRTPTVTVRDLTLDGGFNDDQIGIWVKGLAGPGTRTVNLTLTRVKIFGYTERAIENICGKVTLDHCAIMSNITEGNGGGILNSGFTESGGGTLTIRHSLIAWNSSTDGGGGIANFGKLVMEHSTVAGNGSGGGSASIIAGGGILTSEADNPGFGVPEMILNHVTVAENFADHEGGGVAVDPNDPTIVVSTSNSIFTLNADGAGGQDFSGPSGSNRSGNGPNLFSRAAATLQTKGSDRLNESATIGELDDWGGLFPTYPLARGSVAIDRANGSAISDQRDFFRPTDGNGDGNSARDLGAYEHDPNGQTETARLMAKSSDTHATFSNSAYSNGRGSRLESNAAGDFVTYAMPVTSPGTYAVKVRIERGANRGRFQVAYQDDTTGAFVDLGTVKDGYAASSSMTELTIGNVSYSFEGMKQFRFRVAGRNSSSTGYRMYFDYIKLSPL